MYKLVPCLYIILIYVQNVISRTWILIKEMWNIKNIKWHLWCFIRVIKAVYVIIAKNAANAILRFVCVSAMLAAVIFVWTNKSFSYGLHTSMVHYACRKFEHICCIPNWIFKLSVQSGKESVVIWNTVLFAMLTTYP